MRKSLKNKILIGVPVIFITVMLIVTVVVSLILSKQNEKVANTLIQNAFNIVRYTISERQEKLLFDSRQMASTDNMGRKIKYVMESSSYFEYDTLKPTYTKIAGELYSISTTADVWKANIYNSDGNLMAFTVIEEDGSTLGCVHNRETIEIASLKPDEELTPESWTKQDSLPAGTGYSFGRAILDREVIHFEIIDNSLCMVAYVPVLGKSYNPLTEKLEAEQVGMVVTAWKLDTAFVKKMAELTGTEINIFTSGVVVCCGTYANYRTFDLSGFADVKSRWVLTEQPVTFSDVDIAGGSYFQGVLPIYSDSKCVAAIVSLYSKEMAKANTMQIIKLLSLVYFVGVILIVPITILVVVHGIINPIQRVASMMREIAHKKDFTKMLKIESQDEIGDLASSFNEMTEDLRNTTTSIDNLNREIAERKKAEEQIRKSQKVLQDMIDSMPFGVMVIGRDKKIKQINATACQLTDYSEGELVGQLCYKVLCPAEENNCPILDQNQTVDHSERKFITKDRREVPIIKSVIQLKLGDEDVLLEAFIDITERKEAERKLEQLNEDLADTIAELDKANNELKDFVYIASHDLREPLRKISSFGELLSNSLKDKLNDDDKENFKFMIDGAMRMQQMIDALLTYSRITTGGVDFEPVDLNKVVEELCAVELAVRVEETGAKIEVPERLHNVNCDPVQIRQLMQNLIANGLKYHKKDVTPEITVRSSVADNGMIRVEVTDNGIGIKKEQFKDVFVMFKRLHSRREYEGAGIGLAVCKKIVRRHGGDIGVSSTYDQGSTFWFTMPAASKTPAEEQVELVSSSNAEFGEQQDG